MDKNAKIEFFLNCQDLLITHHPDSHFLLRKKDIEKKIPYVQDFYHKYKGFCYQDANISVLYNHIIIADPKEPVEALKNNMWKEPHAEYNGVSIDFVVFRNIMDCLGFAKSHYDPRIKHVLFVKNNQPKIYETQKLVSRTFHLPFS